MNKRILIVEDEARLREVLCDYFISRGELPVEAADGPTALTLAGSEEFDAVLLDFMMPGLDGFSVCRVLRQKSDVPIIFLTALSDEEDKLYGYELGADDYITKPFSLSLLYAKTTALIRRSRGNMRESDSLRVGKIRIDPRSRRVWAGGREISLGPREYALLLCLAQNQGMVMSREQLLVKCWGYDYEGEPRVVDTQIKRLREKLGRHADCIRTVIKAGYIMEAQDEKD